MPACPCGRRASPPVPFQEGEDVDFDFGLHFEVSDSEEGGGSDSSSEEEDTDVEDGETSDEEGEEEEQEEEQEEGEGGGSDSSSEEEDTDVEDGETSDEEGEEEDSEEEQEEGEGEGVAEGCGPSAAARVPGGATAAATERANNRSICLVCMEPWTSQGVHRTSCIPCGHVYGRSCLERQLTQRGNTSAKCPQCARRFKHKDIITIYEGGDLDQNLEKQILSCKEKIEFLGEVVLKLVKLSEEIIAEKNPRSTDLHVAKRQKVAEFSVERTYLEPLASTMEDHISGSFPDRLVACCDCGTSHSEDHAQGACNRDPTHALNDMETPQ